MGFECKFDIHANGVHHNTRTLNLNKQMKQGEKIKLTLSQILPQDKNTADLFTLAANKTNYYCRCLCNPY